MLKALHPLGVLGLLRGLLNLCKVRGEVEADRQVLRRRRNRCVQNDFREGRPLPGAGGLMSMIHADALPHRIYNLSSGYTTSAREQLLTLYRIRPDAARQVNLDPETLRAQPYPLNGYNADLLTSDTGWCPQYTFEEALEDYLKWLSEHPY
jgi:hypothetical protein